ncbi:MAG: hypothetical protein Q7J44_01795 [Pseudotabrizicola sp.]|uniref:hypothetical protein n=1 Tax=Pseudotabrizicola sp. TaxID=2939647 RepID=UPI002724345E|nr:hypothetical protein [Pseudotabrizicola sp.]MDO9637256.1 hypothetical protein [Pseudotabrizicola sp.]
MENQVQFAGILKAMKMTLSRWFFIWLAASATSSNGQVVEEVIMKVPCGVSIQAALARDKADDAIFRQDEKDIAYAFLLGLGSNDPRLGDMKEVYGRSIGAAVYFCGRNPDATLFDIGRMIGRG